MLVGESDSLPNGLGFERRGHLALGSLHDSFDKDGEEGESHERLPEWMDSAVSAPRGSGSYADDNTYRGSEA